MVKSSTSASARGRLFIAALWSLIAVSATAQTEIHRCTAADGSVIFSQMPCESDVASDPESEVGDEATEANEDSDQVNPDSAPRVSAHDDGMLNTTAEFTVTMPIAPKPDETCQKKYRDAIDEIDAEMRREYTAEKSDEYKERLLTLTAKLRQC